MAKITERGRLWLTIGASVLVTGGITALVFSDRADIRTTEEEITAFDERIESADVEIRRTKDREDKVIVFREVQSRELEILPKQQEIAGFHQTLTTFLANSGAKFTKMPDNAPKESELTRGVYVTPNTIECEADATSLLRLVNLIENDPRLVAVKGLNVKAGARTRDQEEGQSHKVRLHLETYFYAPPAKTKDAIAIPNVAERLEDPVIKKLIADFQPERRDSYALRPSASRRDPFVDFRKEIVAEDPELTRTRFQTEENITLDVEKRHDLIREKSETEKSLSGSGALFQYDRVRQELDELINELRVRVANVASIRSVTFPELMARNEKVRLALEEVATTRQSLPRVLAITVAVATETRDAIQKAFGDADYPEVNTITTQWEQFLRGKIVEEAAQPLNEEIRGYRLRSKKLSEFHAKGVHVTGVVVNKTQPAQSVALISGEVRHVGDAIDNKGEIIVAGITATGVEFAYQGETIRVARGNVKSPPSPSGTSVPVSVPVPSNGGSGR